MPKKVTAITETMDNKKMDTLKINENAKEDITKLNRMLAAVLNYLADDEVEEIDIDYILDKTDGLRDWWEHYRENNRKELEEEVRNSLGELSLEELVQIREQIKEKQH